MTRDQWTIYHAFRAAFPVDVRIAVVWSALAGGYVVTVSTPVRGGIPSEALVIRVFRTNRRAAQMVPNLRLQEMAEAEARASVLPLLEQVENAERGARTFLGTDPFGGRSLLPEWRAPLHSRIPEAFAVLRGMS